MTIDDCFQLGYIVKSHGLNGEVQALIDADHPEVYNQLESVFVKQGQSLVPFFIEYIKITGDKALIAFEEIEGVDAARSLKGLELYLPLDLLPELDDSSFYMHEVIDFELIDHENNKVVGKVTSLLEAGPQLIFQVDRDGIEILIPYQKELLIRIDRKNQQIELKIPEGLLDVYLSNED